MNQYLVTFVFEDGKCIDVEVIDISCYGAHVSAFSKILKEARAQGTKLSKIVALRISLKEAIN